MNTRAEKITIPLDWMWDMRIERYIPELHQRDFEAFDRKVRALLSPIFAEIPELDITGSMQTRLNDRTQRFEVFYQPVLISARQSQLQFDDQRSGELEIALKSCLEEFLKLPMLFEMLSNAGQVKSLTSLSPQEYQAQAILRTMVNSSMLKRLIANNRSLNPQQTKFPEEVYQLSFRAIVKFKGRKSVLVKTVHWSKSNPVFLNQRDFEVGFRQYSLLDEGENYLDLFEHLLRSEQSALFICKVSIEKVKGGLKVGSAFLEKLITD